MVSESRRKILKSLGVSTLGMTAFSGCSSFITNEARIKDLTLMNLDGSAHDILVKVIRNDNMTYKNTFSLKPPSAYGDDPYPAPIIAKDWMENAGRFIIKCGIKSKENIEVRQFPSEKHTGDCFSVEIVVSEGGILSVPYTRQESCKQTTK